MSPSRTVMILTPVDARPCLRISSTLTRSTVPARVRTADELEVTPLVLHFFYT